MAAIKVEQVEAIKIYYSYAIQDEPSLKNLEKHLATLKRQGSITTWYKQQVIAGAEWRQECERRLNQADIILLLVSPDFVVSDFCYNIEMTRALERHRTGEALVIPIILRFVEWENTPLRELQVLPRSKKPIISSSDRDRAFMEVAIELRDAISVMKIFTKRQTTERTFLPIASSDKKIKRLYLHRMILETEVLNLKGVPSGLVAEGAPLDEIFVSLEFRPNRPLSDYPLAEAALKEYHEFKNEALAEELERLLFEAERSWHLRPTNSERISITELWQQLTRDHPVAVIQGYPGMGKSTLLARLTLFMARRGLNEPDSLFPPSVRPLVPILIKLGDYAIERAKTPALSISGYIELVASRLNVPNAELLLQEHLKKGQCLVLLDGLDEVSDAQMRKEVQEAIQVFILEQRNILAKKVDFNRFLITSRVAGYDQAAFPNYLHYTIGELLSKQIEEFLPRWYRANTNRNSLQRREVILEQAELMSSNLITAIKYQQGVRELAENPLLLTLLAIMQQNGIEIPRQRVELYRVVTIALLEDRNIAKGLPAIPEALAIRYLCPLAFQMQKKGSSFIRSKEVIAALKQTIHEETGGTDSEVEYEAKKFLNRIRERGGLFVQRAGDYFGFFHRTFQEYFASRYLLNEINDEPSNIAALVTRARSLDDIWREPFLLAVAYKSGEDEITANQIIHMLLSTPQDASRESQEHDLLLAAECIIEAKLFTTSFALERQVSESLLNAYEESQQSQQFKMCDRIETLSRRWLVRLPKEAFRSAFLVVLREAISDTSQGSRQFAALTLLVLVARQLVSCTPIIFDTLVPPLLALAGLPKVGKYQPVVNIPTASDLMVADLALSALSLMGKQGPAGILLADIRQHFQDHPEHVDLLAHHSLESQILLTPVAVPQEEANYQSYISAIRQWIILRDRYEFGQITRQEINAYRRIHQALLDCAEESRYPSAIHLLNILQAEADYSSQPWQQIWQEYLLEQLESGSYIHYQEVILLWIILFPKQEALNKLATLLLEHYNSDRKPVQLYAQRFLMILSNNLRDMRYIHDMRYLRYFPDIMQIRYLRDTLEMLEIAETQTVTEHKYVPNMRRLLELQEIIQVRLNNDMRYIKNMRHIRYMVERH